MKSVVLAVIGLFAVSTGVPAQSAIEMALSAAPAGLREDAAVIQWRADFSYETLKDGTNHLVCYDRSTQRNRRPFEVQCTTKANLGRVEQNRRFRAATADGAEERAMIGAAEADGTRAPVEYGSIWYAAAGADYASAASHTTIAVPGATGESTGFPTTRDSGGVYLMQAGTGGAHLMVPGR